MSDSFMAQKMLFRFYTKAKLSAYRSHYNKHLAHPRSAILEKNSLLVDERVGNVKIEGPCMPNMIWTLCLFCQEEKANEKLISVTSFNASNAILESSALDNKLRVQLAGINDLIASGGKYHKKC